jgi:uncharacterized protein (TIGR03083 family)
MPLWAIPATDTRPFFRPVAAELIALLRGLPEDAWQRPTVAGRWVVRDVAAHLLDVGLRRLAFHRDRHVPPAAPAPPRGDREFVAFINGLNQQWIDAAARLSPRVLTDLLEVAGDGLAAFAESFPDDGAACFPVSWAGDASSAGRFDLGREFTEQWHHQAQIRDAVGAPPLRDPRWLHAVLLIALRALPHAYRETAASPGSALTLHIDGPAGGVWTLARGDDGWTLWAGEADHPAAAARLSDDTAWRLLFNALPRERARDLVAADGDAALTAPLLGARSVIV